MIIVATTCNPEYPIVSWDGTDYKVHDVKNNKYIKCMLNWPNVKFSLNDEIIYVQIKEWITTDHEPNDIQSENISFGTVVVPVDVPYIPTSYTYSTHCEEPYIVPSAPPISPVIDSSHLRYSSEKHDTKKHKRIKEIIKRPYKHLSHIIDMHDCEYNKK